MIDLILVIISLIWLVYASYQDIKNREVSDWISYSLVIIALMFYSIESLVLNNFSFIFQSLFGLLGFYLLGNLMYYTKQWGGGDVKLLSALGALFPIYPKELLNYLNPSLELPFLLILILNLIICGAAYSLSYSFYLIIKNKDKLKLNFKINKTYLFLPILISIMTFAVNDITVKLLILFLALLILIYPYIKNYISLVEKQLMIKKISVIKLTEGDWLIEDVYHQGKLLYNKNNPGITLNEINLLKKYKIKNVLVKEGLPFIPNFLFAFIISLIFGNLFMI